MEAPGPHDFKAELVDDVATARLRRFREASTVRFEESVQRGERYANAVLLGGYVAFFTLWGGMAGDLPRVSVMASGALLGLSAMTYLLHEVAAMAVVRAGERRFRAIYAAGIPDDFEDRWRAAQAGAASDYARLELAWLPIFLVSLCSGLGGGAWLCAAAVRYVLERAG